MTHPGFLGADPDQVDALAYRLSAAADHLDEIRATLGRQLDRTYWDGPEADEFRANWHGHHTRRLVSAATALRTAAQRAHDNAADQRGASRAEVGGGALAGAGSFGSGSAAPPEVQQFWASLSQPQQAALLNLGMLEWLGEFLGLTYPGEPTPAKVTGWALGLAGLAAGAATDWMVKVRHSTFKPKFPPGSGSGKFLPRGVLPFWHRFYAAMDSRNWSAKRGRATILPKWEAAGRVVGGAGVAVTAVIAGWEQWEADAQDPSLDTEAKVARAAWSGGTTAAGAWAVGYTGAVWGGALGTAIFPGPGTVIGGLVGGLVGGAIGAWGGHEIGQVLIDPIGDAASWVGDRIGDVGEGLAALKFW